MQRLTTYAHLFPNDVQDVIGLDVLDRSGQKLGQVQAVFTDDTQQKIRFLEVAGELVRLVPVESILGIDRLALRLNLSGEVVFATPSIAPNADLPAWAALYRHYDLVPHWEAENIFRHYTELK